MLYQMHVSNAYTCCLDGTVTWLLNETCTIYARHLGCCKQFPSVYELEQCYKCLCVTLPTYSSHGPNALIFTLRFWAHDISA